ncbi:MAG: exosortase/archaeosortase family protein [Planctomycetaceae bacterium]
MKPAVVCGVLALAAVLLWSYWDTLAVLVRRWSTEADYSHGFLVPVFSVVLLWHRRAMLAGGWPQSGSWWGLAFLALAGLMRWAAAYLFYPLLDAPSLLPCLAGVVLLLGGWKALHWSWPAIAYLIFMIPLPASIAETLSSPLQRIATESSTWILQTLGVPAIARGNVIWLATGKIGVVEACSGLRMLMLFAAITVGASFLIERPLWEKIFVALSALVIGLITNIIRITVTAILHEYVGQDLAQRVFHDLAGWLMMPVATLLLFIELQLLSKLLIVPVRSDPVLVRH